MNPGVKNVSTSIAPTNGETDVDGPDVNGEGTADFSQLVGGGTEASSDSSNNSQPHRMRMAKATWPRPVIRLRHRILIPIP